MRPDVIEMKKREMWTQPKKKYNQIYNGKNQGSTY